MLKWKNKWRVIDSRLREQFRAQLTPLGGGFSLEGSIPELSASREHLSQLFEPMVQ